MHLTSVERKTAYPPSPPTDHGPRTTDHGPRTTDHYEAGFHSVKYLKDNNPRFHQTTTIGQQNSTQGLLFTSRGNPFAPGGNHAGRRGPWPNAAQFATR
ncbi:MAG: hypothetical protein LBG84_07495, partial [Treponema sp.]|nr:hypothetical protein [Treponema sp.]